MTKTQDIVIKKHKIVGILCFLSVVAISYNKDDSPLSDHSNTLYPFNKCFAIDIGFTFNFSCPYSSGLPYGKLANVPFFVGQKQKEKRRCKNRLFSFLAPPVRPFGYDVFL